jgi:hypothetical protein
LPMLERWGFQPELPVSSLERSDKPLAGKIVAVELIEQVGRDLADFKNLFQSQVTRFDELMADNFRFFSIVD